MADNFCVKCPPRTGCPDPVDLIPIYLRILMCITLPPASHCQFNIVRNYVRFALITSHNASQADVFTSAEGWCEKWTVWGWSNCCYLVFTSIYFVVVCSFMLLFYYRLSRMSSTVFKKSMIVLSTKIPIY